MERAVGATHDGGVAKHTLMSYRWQEKCAGDAVPVKPVGAVDKAEPVGGRLMEGGGYVDILGLCSRQAAGQQQWQ